MISDCATYPVLPRLTSNSLISLIGNSSKYAACPSSPDNSKQVEDLLFNALLSTMDRVLKGENGSRDLPFWEKELWALGKGIAQRE